MSYEREVYTVPVPITDRDALDTWIENQQKKIVLGRDVVPTPFPTWNKACRDEGGGMGLARGWHIIVAGNTGSGKSVFALNLAASAMRSGMNVGFVSLEMSVTQLQTRFYAIISGEPIRELERGLSFDLTTAQRATDYAEKLTRKKGSWFVTNLDLKDPIREIGEVIEAMDTWIERHNCRFFVVDYMQLVGSGDSTEVAQQVMQVSRAMMGYAKSRKVVTVGLSQYNRQTSKNYDTPPTPQGLFGSSGLENDAHQVMLLDHSRYRDTESGVLTWAILGKNRHGMKPEIPVRMSKTDLRFMEAEPDEENDWPGIHLAA